MKKNRPNNSVRNRGIAGNMGGMGMHKHAVSGRSKNKALSIGRSLELNKKQRQDEIQRERIRKMNLYSTVPEAFRRK